MTATGSQLWVGMGEMKILATKGVLCCRDFGATLALYLYEPELKLGGLARIMLPVAPNKDFPIRPAMYANQALPALVLELERAGAVASHLKAVVLGGTTLFGASPELDPQYDFGLRNREWAAEFLESSEIARVDVLSPNGKLLSAHLNVSSGEFAIRRFAEEDAHVYHLAA